MDIQSTIVWFNWFSSVCQKDYHSIYYGSKLLVSHKLYLCCICLGSLVFTKISRIAPWVSMYDKLMQRTLMWLNLYGPQAVQFWGLKQAKNTRNVFFACFKHYVTFVSLLGQKSRPGICVKYFLSFAQTNLSQEN